MFGPKSLDDILNVFTKTKGELENFMQANQEDLDDLNDRLIVATRNQSKAKSTHSKLTELLGE